MNKVEGQKIRSSISLVFIVMLLAFSFGTISSGIPILQGESTFIRSPTFRTAQYTNHAPIIIENDSDFQLRGFNGSGTKADPYVMEDMNISNDYGQCIVIEHTSAYFIIRHSVMRSADDAMYLNAMGNGTIQDCTIRAYFSGIQADNCTSLELIGNDIVGSEYGVSLSGVNDTEVQNCRIHHSNNGLALHRSQRINITGCVLYANFGYGIYVGHASGGIYVFSNSIGWNGDYTGYTLNTTTNALDDSTVGRGRTDDWIGNHWSDYNGTGPYLIPGVFSKNDSLPTLLIDAVAPSVSGDEDMRLYIGETGQYIHWNSSDVHMFIFRVYLDGSQVSSGYWYGGQLEYTLDGLSVGSHNYTAVFFDCAGNGASNQIWVSILLDIFGEGTILIFYNLL